MTNITKINVSRKWHESVADIRKLGRRENRLQLNAEKHESGGSIGQTDTKTQVLRYARFKAELFQGV